MQTRSLALAALIALGASGLSAQTGADLDVAPPTAEEMQAAMTMPEAFAARAASSNTFEIMSSQLALEKSQTSAVTAFAEHMIADHSAAGEKMMAAAAAEGVTPAATLMPDHKAQLDNLAATGAEDFDAAYLGAQQAAHNEAVQLFDGYSTQGAEGELKSFATETLPTLRQHLEEVMALSAI